MTASESAPERSPHEEVANTATHAFGFVLSLIGTWFFLHVAPALTAGEAAACFVFAATLLVLYAVSALSHLIPPSRWQNRLRSWDQGAVYLLIAGTYTPFAWVGAASPSRELFLLALWGAATIGFLSKVVVRHRVNSMRPHSYILLGWVPALYLFYGAPTQVLFWVAMGGVSYTIGVGFLTMDRRAPYLHAAWHLFVVAGSSCHYYAIYLACVSPHFVATGTP